jgi:Sulfatase-modifying factor enzyme 1
MVKQVITVAGLAAFAGLCSCGAPELTYRDDTPSFDGGVDAPPDSLGDSSQETGADVTSDAAEDGFGDVVTDSPGDAPLETQPDAPTEDAPIDVTEDAPIDVTEDAPIDVTEDAPIDVTEDAPIDSSDATLGCPDDMVSVPRGNGTSFCIDATEVTQQAFDAWLSAAPDPSSQPSYCALNLAFEPDLGACVGGSYTPAVTPDLPVTCVDWCDAFAYCASLGRRLCGGLDGSFTKYNKYQDAAESQWMRACSAGGTMQYPYGNAYQGTLCNGADFGANTIVTAESSDCVGGVSGLYDMSGNVGEWEDCCSGAAPSASCRIRGGSYADGTDGLRCDAASELHRDERSSTVGFRCCGD